MPAKKQKLNLSSNRLSEEELNIEVPEIKVVGPKKTTPKTVVASLDSVGLIRLKFQEGGELPALLAGRFTTIEQVQSHLVTYADRNKGKTFELHSIELAPASQEGTLRFDEIVDPALDTEE